MSDSWCTTENMNQVCEHGSQRRKCIHCESAWQDERIAELEQQVSELQTYKLGFQGADEKAIALEVERDRLRELLDIFKDACDPGKLDQRISMYRCEKHGGHGFVSDCEICTVEKMLTERDKRIAELEQELAIGVNVIRDYEQRMAELEAELSNTAPYYMDCLDREKALVAERDRLREALQEIADDDFKGKAAHIAWGALEEK